jgi:hypothetical protein
MPSLISILRGIGSVPRRINDAMYDDDPILQERRGEIPFPAGLGAEESVAEVPTGEYEEVGRKNRRPSFLGKFIGEGLRGAAIGLARPSTGNTAQDIGQTMLAVGDDRMAREDRVDSKAERMFRLRRQAQQDAENSQLHAAQIDNYRALAEQRRTPKAGRGGFAEVYDAAYQRATKAGMDEATAHGHAMAAWNRNPTGFIQLEPKSVDAFKAQLHAQFARGDIDEQDFKDGQARIVAMEQEIAKGKAQGTTEGKGPPFVRGQIVQSKEGVRWGMPPMMRGGKTVSEGSLSDPIAQRPDPAPRAPREASASEQRFNRDTKVKEIVSRLLAEDTNHSADTALRNVQQFYQNDPEVQQYRGEIVKILQDLARGQGSAAKGSAAAEDVARADKFRKEREAKKAQTAPTAYKFTQEYQGAKYGRNSASEPWKKIQ